VILAAGSGTRFGRDKAVHSIRGKPIWRYSYETFLAHPRIARVVLVASEANRDAIAAEGVPVVLGGKTRAESSRIGVSQSFYEDIVLVHDAARPFVSADVIDRVLDGIERAGAAAPCLNVTDTIRHQLTGDTVDRDLLRAMQTPQGGLVSLMNALPAEEATDEMELFHRAGLPFELVSGEVDNFKVTHASDLRRVSAVLGPPETRTGLGYDIHACSDDPDRVLMLGGVAFPDHPALDGHSDADVICHAVCDAVMGAIALGDIGEHFPNTDPAWKGKSSLFFLEMAASLICQKGWRIVNIDVSVLAETPKIMKRASEMRSAMATALGTTPDRLSVKATTNEKLGAIGRSEGIAAFATATLAQID
jgi:2-C-methyl-D-erythritol 4-phosphate cytidylyltransferase / 2-C-methyl-D-erythritol 2,4-cyclodiphosphate synthase